MVTGVGRLSGRSARLAAVSQFSWRRPKTGDRIAPPMMIPIVPPMTAWIDVMTRLRNFRRSGASGEECISSRFYSMRTALLFHLFDNRHITGEYVRKEHGNDRHRDHQHHAVLDREAEETALV